MVRRRRRDDPPPWLKDDALGDPDLLPAPGEVAAEIVESLETALIASARLRKRLASGPDQPAA